MVTTPLQTPHGPVKHSYNGLKIFERVTGAALVGRGWPPNARVVARLPLQTNTGRKFVYSAFARADPHGSVTIPVAYTTDVVGDSGVVPLADAYAVGVASSTVRRVPVPAAAVDTGGRVVMELK